MAKLPDIIKSRLWVLVNENNDEQQIMYETSGDIVKVESTKFVAKNVLAALNEIADMAANGGVTGVKGDAESTYRKGNVNITKANIGLGNVDNTADANKSVKHATSADSATTATSATTANSATKATQDASGNVITSTYATKTELQEGLAGKSQSKTYNNYQAFVTAVNAMNNTALKVGDNVFIVTQDVPDMWVSAVNSSSATYTYSSDSAIVTALGSANGLTVGYYVFRELETEKVDLTAYQTKTDNTLNTTSKTVVEAINEVQATADSVSSRANSNTTAIGDIITGKTRVGKASTADDAANVTTNINGQAISNIFESDGTTVKNATNATNATNAKMANRVANALFIGAATPDNPTMTKMSSFTGKDILEVSFEEGEFLGDESVSHGKDYTIYRRYIKLSPTGVTPNTYSAVTVDAKGRVTQGFRSFAIIEAGADIPADVPVGGLIIEKMSV